MDDRPRTTPYPLRMPNDLRRMLEAAAKDGNRSLHAEIVARLADSFESPRLGFGPGSASDQFERARSEAIERLEAAVPAIADRVAALVNERMKSGEK